MQIQINTDHNIKGHEALAAQVRGVVESALSHLSDHITRVEVHLSDESSHKSTQNDKRCMMEARLEGRQPIAVTDEEDTVVQAVDGAAGKLARLIESTLGGSALKRVTGLTRLRLGRLATNQHTEVSEMNPQDLIDTAKAMVADDKGLLAMDESNPTCNKRFAKLGIPQTVEARRAYRELIVTTPDLGECISGVILYDETIRQQKKDGTPFVKVITDAGIIPGIKVDTGAKDLAGHPGEKITEGLDGLRERLAEYSQMGARFAKWRAVIAVGDGIPSRGCIEANAQALARYAALCQEAGLVPVVEPEVLMDGEHTLERCCEVTEEVLRTVFNHLYTQRVCWRE